MIDVHFVILGAAIGAVGQAGYVRDTIRGVTQPNRVTFLLWAAAPLLAFAVEIHAGIGLQALMTFMVGIGPLAIFLASFVNRSSAAVWRIGPLDYVCGALSVLGTVAWLVTRHGTVALAASLLADALAGLPTVLKSWRQPETESAILYVGSTINAGITLLTINRVTSAALAFPLYIFVLGLFEVLLVGGRLGPRLRDRARGVKSRAR